MGLAFPAIAGAEAARLSAVLVTASFLASPHQWPLGHARRAPLEIAFAPQGAYLVFDREENIPGERSAAVMRLDAEQIEVVDDAMAEVLRAKSGAERLRIAGGMFASARRTIIHLLRTQHPDWSEEEIVAETARRLSHGAV